jgi:hypothetical protein
MEATPSDRQPFPIEAMAVEDDSYLVLGAERVVSEPAEHPLHLLHRAASVEPVMPGTVVVRDGPPLRLLAVVHHLERQPSWSEGWILEALDTVLELVRTRRVRSLGLQPLGTVHGRLPLTRFMGLLAHRLARSQPRALRYLWIAVPPGLDLAGLDRFRAEL